MLATGDSERVVEGHPEVRFRAFNGEALSYKKKSALGVDERLSTLDAVPEYSEGDWRTVAKQLKNTVFEIGLDDVLDDVLDAFALALTAYAPDEESPVAGGAT